jgi:hypothetical protein
MLDAAPLLEHIHRRLLRAWAACNVQGDVATCDVLRALDLRMLAAQDDRFDPLALVREGVALLRGASEVAADDAAREQIAEFEPLLRDLERALGLLGFRSPSPRWGQRALRRLVPQHLERPIIAPATAPPLREAAPAPAPRLLSDALPALTPAGFCLQRMDELFFDLCAGLLHRRPQGAELWTSVRPAEVRALRALDALLALDLSLLGAFEAQIAASPALDPTWVLGLTVLGGCLSGRDGLAMAERFLQQPNLEPEALAAHAEGLVLSAHPLVESIAREHLSSAEPEWRRLGAHVLGTRGSASVAELVACSRDVPEVAAEALVPLARLGLPEFRSLLDELHAGAMQAGGTMLHAYLEAALVSGHPFAIDFLGSTAQGGDGHAIRLLGVAGERREAGELFNWCRTAPSVPLADALGWSGDPHFIELLIDLLGSDDEALTHAAAGALERITGAGLLELVPIDPGAESGPPAGPAFAADARDPVAEGSPDLIELPSRDAAQWKAYVKAHEAELKPGVRTRRGVAYTPSRSHADLEHHACTFEERRLLYLELMVRTGWTFRLDLGAFVDEQAAGLAELGPLVAGHRGAAGDWTRPMQRQALGVGLRALG